MLDNVENTIIQTLFYDNDYFCKVFPHLSSEVFENQQNNIIFSNIKEYVSKTENRPNIREIALQISNSTLDKDKKKSSIEALKTYSTQDKITDIDFLLQETQKYIKRIRLTNAIYESADIINKGEKFEPIIEKVQNALDVNFDTLGGLEYNSSIVERLDYYHNNLKGLSCGVKSVDNMINGGFMNKTLNLFLSPSGGGKSAALVSVGANLILKKKNILYITLEMSELEIGKRFDANILDYTTKDLKEHSKENIKKAFDNIQHMLGKLIIKEYSAGTFNTLMLKNLIEDFRNTRDIKFDIIIIDYMTLMSSYRTTLAKSNGTYGYYKSIAEELHGFSKTCNDNEGIPILSACQLNRSSFNNLEVDMSGIADSIGIVQTADLLIGILSNEALRERKESIWKIMKNRNSGILKDVLVKADFSKMRFSEADDTLDNTELKQELELNASPTLNFGDFKF